MANKKKKSLSAFSILFIILISIFIVSKFLNGMTFDMATNKSGESFSSVVGATLPSLVMAPYNGFLDAIDISIFVLVLGGFLGIVQATGALEAGIHSLVKKKKDREISLIVILMILFSIGGTTFGMAEETMAFYGIITMALVTAGFDSLVGAATILLGAGSGVLGSTVNPFAVGTAVEALNSIGIKANQGIILLLGTFLWISTTIVSIYFVTKYARKVQKDKGSTLLSLQEQENMENEFQLDNSKSLDFTKIHKLILFIFACTFIVMIVALAPWQNLGINIFEGWSDFLTGETFGNWSFGEVAMWFFIMGIVIAFISGMEEKQVVKEFVDGASEVLSVVLIIVVSRGVSVLMQTTHIDALILDRASKALYGLSPIIFVLGAYILYVLLSFLIPSTSGLAFVSIPVMGGLAEALGMSPEVMIMIFTAGCGLVNLITPTSGVVMGGLEMAKVEYSTWLKFVTKPIIVISLMNFITLCLAIIIF